MKPQHGGNWMIRTLLGKPGQTGRRIGRAARRRKLGLESLEQRTLLSVGGLDAGPDLQFELLRSAADPAAVVDPAMIPPPINEWTVMVYLNGDNNLSPAALDDVNEMEAVVYPDDLEVVVLADLDGSDDTYRGLITHDTNPGTVTSPLQHLGEFNMGNPQNLTDFITWGQVNHPAERYALIMWDHGGGFTGFGDPEELEVFEIRTAIEAAGPDLSLIGFDACVMGMTEVAYELRNVCDVYVGSEANEPFEGWPYTEVLTPLAADPAMSAIQLGQTIVSEYGGTFNQATSYETMSSIITAGMDPLAAALGDFSDAVTANATTADVTALRSARGAAESYGYSAPYNSFRDLGEFLSAVAAAPVNAAISNAAANANAMLAATVDANWTGGQTSGDGLSIYLPGLGSSIDYEYDADLAFVADTNWEDFFGLMTGDDDLIDTVGFYDPSDTRFYLKNSNSGGGAGVFHYSFGVAGVPITGDWDGNGSDTVGIYDPTAYEWHLKNSHDDSPPDITFTFAEGGPYSIPLAGDWDGDGIDAIGLYDPDTGWFYLKDTNDPAPPTVSFQLGPAGAGWQPLAGDWDGDGLDTIGLYAPGTAHWYLKNSNTPGPGDLVHFELGPGGANWIPVTGDWNGNGTDTIGLYSRNTTDWYLKNSNNPSGSDIVHFKLGLPGSNWTPLTGDWDGPTARKAAATDTIYAAAVDHLGRRDEFGRSGDRNRVHQKPGPETVDALLKIWGES